MSSTLRGPLSLDRIARAAREIDPVFLHSPQFRAESLGARLGVELTVKVETVNPIRSFKGRGADFFLRELSDTSAHLVCASAGNFGQGLAYAARNRGMRLDVFASIRANPLKIERMRSFGARVQLAGDDFDAAKDAGRRFADGAKGLFVEDGREPAISEGAGTIAVELLAGGDAPDVLIVPLGNGALLGGVATWTKAKAPDTRIIGVCAAGAPSMQLSWKAQRVVETDSTDTIADGIAVRVPIPEAVADLHQLIDDIVLVDDSTTVEAMRLLFGELGLVIEPAGAVGVAALLADRDTFSGARVSTILCGGNLTAEQVSDWLRDP